MVVDLRHQQIMGQGLAHLHNPNNGGIDLVLTILVDSFSGASLLLHLREGAGGGGTQRNHDNLSSTRWVTMRMRASAPLGQGYTVSFIWIWLILILKSLCLKSSLHENLSPSSMSLLFGTLVRTRALPQASDCRVRRSSLSSITSNTHTQTHFKTFVLRAKAQ